MFSAKDDGVYITGDDATVREYAWSGELLHQASVPAQGDRIRLLYDRFLAVLRSEDAANVPVMDTKFWDHDPVLLATGDMPVDMISLSDGKTVIAAAKGSRRVAQFELPSGLKVADITLGHDVAQLFLVKSENRSHVAALGPLILSGRPAGAWLDFFDPNESPFGATRRSVAVGRMPGVGAVASTQTMLLVPDQASNSVDVLRVSVATETAHIALAASPKAAYFLQKDRYGVTINPQDSSLSVVDINTLSLQGTVMLPGVPNVAAVSPDQRFLLVTLGGSEWPPKGKGAVIVGGDPPRLLTHLDTGKGPCAVAVSRDGRRAAIAVYHERAILLLEKEK